MELLPHLERAIADGRFETCSLPGEIDDLRGVVGLLKLMALSTETNHMAMSASASRRVWEPLLRQLTNTDEKAPAALAVVRSKMAQRDDATDDAFAKIMQHVWVAVTNAQGMGARGVSQLNTALDRQGTTNTMISGVMEGAAE